MPDENTPAAPRDQDSLAELAAYGLSKPPEEPVEPAEPAEEVAEAAELEPTEEPVEAAEPPAELTPSLPLELTETVESTVADEPPPVEQPAAAEEPAPEAEPAPGAEPAPAEEPEPLWTPEPTAWFEPDPAEAAEPRFARWAPFLIYLGVFPLPLDVAAGVYFSLKAQQGIDVFTSRRYLLYLVLVGVSIVGLLVPLIVAHVSARRALPKGARKGVFAAALVRLTVAILLDVAMATGAILVIDYYWRAFLRT
jgi:hypothetical protein